MKYLLTLLTLAAVSCGGTVFQDGDDASVHDAQGVLDASSTPDASYDTELDSIEDSSIGDVDLDSSRGPHPDVGPLSMCDAAASCVCAERFHLCYGGQVLECVMNDAGTIVSVFCVPDGGGD